MALRKTSLFVFLLLLFGLCLKLNAQIGEATDKIIEQNDILYYTDTTRHSELTRLNILAQENLDEAPVFIWIGGGAWAYVDRNKEMPLCRKMAQHGIVVVSAGHRLSPALLGKEKRHEGVKHPAHVTDLAHAFKWVYEHIDEYGGDKNNIFVGGFSSGAHLSTLLAADKTYLEEVGLTTELIRAIIPVGGGYDIPHYRDLLAEADSAYLENHIYPVFGRTEKEQLDASPIIYLDDFDTPMLMISESSTYPYAIVFEEALSEKGYDQFQVLNVHTETHASLWTALSNDENCIYRDFIAAYIHSMSREEK